LFLHLNAKPPQASRQEEERQERWHRMVYGGLGKAYITPESYSSAVLRLGNIVTCAQSKEHGQA
jgi:hypothetical protein